MLDASGFGLIIQVVASFTFPVGFNITQYAGDADPFDLPSIQIADKEMDVNGNLIVWAKATPINVTINVVPFSEEDDNLAILANANRPERGKLITRDKITLTGIYNSGRTTILRNGRMTDFAPGISVASSQKLKSKPYVFTFQGLSST